MIRFRKNNSGFSLVEVLISLGILGIIVVPLLGNFIASQNVNRSLRNKQAATALAQSTMEMLKSMNMQDTASNFNINSAFNLSGYTHGSVMELAYNGTNYVTLPATYSGVVKDDSVATVYKNTATGDAVYNPKSTGKYIYAINDVEDGINKYDVLVKFDSDAYRTYTDDSGNVVNGYNSQSLSAITGLDTLRTALITTTESIENDAALYFEALIGDSETRASDIKKGMYAQTEITISGTDDPSAKDEDRLMKVEAKITYAYNYPKTDTDYTKEEIIFANTYDVSEETHLEKIYILFNESSGSKHNNNSVQCDTFKITVDNESSFSTINPKVYVIKQGDEGDNCHYNIMLNQKAKAMLTSFYSNVDDGFLNKFSVIAKTANFDKSIYVVTNDFFSGSAGVTASSEENRIYEMTVLVYESNESNRYSNLITSMTSTRREK